MARGYRDRFCTDDVHTQVGEHCLLSFVDAGAERGNLLPSLAARFRWLPVATARADVLLFDSFVPHGSKSNRSAGPRPALFLTFVPGSGYAAYHNYYFEKFGYRAEESDWQPSPAGSA
jgi:ectoine hydroxylase-related dioxygenase (phytanoyl-CoA dioxygenase family)